MKNALTDEEIIRQHGSTQPRVCFETLYNRYVHKVYRRCYSLTKDQEQAQDYTQDIFMRVFERLDRFEQRSTFSTWLYAITFNYCMDQLRLNKRLLTAPLEEGSHRACGHSPDGDAWETQLRLLEQAMKNLPRQDAQLLRLKYEQGLDIRAIGAQLSLKESAVKMRLKRSRDKVRVVCRALGD